MTDAPATAPATVKATPNLTPLVPPQRGTQSVKKAIDRVTAQIQIDSMISNLAITGDLLHLAYNSVPTKSKTIGMVRGQLSNMQETFKELCLDCGSEMVRLSATSQAILENFTSFYAELTQLKEKTAILVLSDCSDHAHAMSAAMGGLATRFEALKEEAKTINLKAHAAQGEEQEALDELEASIAADREEKEASEAREKRHRELHQILQEQYEELSEELKTEQDRAFALQMTTAITGALAQAAGVAAAAYLQTQTGGLDKVLRGETKSSGDSATTTETDEPESKEHSDFITARDALDAATERKTALEGKIASWEKKVEKAKAKKGDIKAEITILKAEIQGLEDKIDDLNSKISKLEKKSKDKKSKKSKDKGGDLKSLKKKLLKAEAKLEEKTDALEDAEEKKSNQAEKIEDLKDKIEDKNTELEELTTEMASLQRKFDLAKKAYEAVGGALNALSDSTHQMSENALSNLASIREAKREMFKLMLAQREFEMEAQAQAKKLVSRIQRLSGNKVTVEATIRSIEQLITVIKSIISILGTAKKFWQSLGEACEALASTSLMKDITNKIDSGEYTDADRLAFYGSDMFRESIMMYLTDWVALRSVADDFAKTANDLGDRVDEQFGMTLKGEEREELVRELTEELQKVLDRNATRNEKEAERIETLIEEGEEAEAAA